jgi:NDP-hexose 4-ketoreductase
MSRILVLGASGFIGSHVCQAIDATGRLTGIPLRRGIDLAASAMGDIERVFTDSAPDVVVNCVGTTLGRPAALVKGNVVTVARMLEALRVLAKPPRLVHLASSAEYGGRSDDTPIRETDVPDPAGPYGVTKLAGTELVLAAGLDAVVLRIFNISGPGSPLGTLLGRVAADLRTAVKTVRLGSLDAWRDYVDVRDVARAIVLAATRPAPRILNVGRGEAVHARELVHRLVEVSGTGAAVTEEKGGEGNHAGSAASVVRWQRADTTAIRQALGWSPEICVTQSIRDTWHG